MKMNRGGITSNLTLQLSLVKSRSQQVLRKSMGREAFGCRLRKTQKIWDQKLGDPQFSGRGPENTILWSESHEVQETVRITDVGNRGTCPVRDC